MRLVLPHVPHAEVYLSVKVAVLIENFTILEAVTCILMHSNGFLRFL